jgi:hypothetical protein
MQKENHNSICELKSSGVDHSQNWSHVPSIIHVKVYCGKWLFDQLIIVILRDWHDLHEVNFLISFKHPNKLGVLPYVIKDFGLLMDHLVLIPVTSSYILWCVSQYNFHYQYVMVLERGCPYCAHATWAWTPSNLQTLGWQTCEIVVWSFSSYLQPSISYYHPCSISAILLVESLKVEHQLRSSCMPHPLCGRSTSRNPWSWIHK